ncbi:MAG: amidase [Candidatus Solibacter sp.]
MLLEFLQALDSGEKSADDLMAQCLLRIARTEHEVRAWVEVAAEPAGAGLLSGIPFGVKDIFETRGRATEYGSPLYEGRKGSCDALVVDTLRRSGAVMLGKTRTTAFASFDPAPTRNPRFPGHTPGGSSSGSAAAVSAGMVPFAIGSQTLGSVLRPASFCGICGFKPSFGLVPVDGLMTFAPSLDTVGFFTQTAADMAALWSRGFGARFDAELHRAVWLRTPAEDEMQRAMSAAVAHLREQDVVVDELPAPDGWQKLQAAAQTINRYEGARSQHERFEQFGERMGSKLAALIAEGLRIPQSEYEDARARVEQMKVEVNSIFWEYPAILTPAAIGPAPEGLESTGDPAPNAPWTALGVPAIAVPLPVQGGPCAVQVTGAWGRDDALVSVAAQLEKFVLP